jgi:hypothetical protein
MLQQFCEAYFFLNVGLDSSENIKDRNFCKKDKSYNRRKLCQGLKLGLIGFVLPAQEGELYVYNTLSQQGLCAF